MSCYKKVTFLLRSFSLKVFQCDAFTKIAQEKAKMAKTLQTDFSLSLQSSRDPSDSSEDLRGGSEPQLEKRPYSVFMCHTDETRNRNIRHVNHLVMSSSEHTLFNYFFPLISPPRRVIVSLRYSGNPRGTL